MSALSHTTDCGLPGIKGIPYGVHMCHFYEGRDDLAAALVPYFAAGLRNKECCVWITSEPLDSAGARAELRKGGIDPDAEIRRGALSIRSHADWHASAGELKGAAVVELWFAEERRALAAGFSGLRISGNVTFAKPEAWATFMEYEETLDEALHGHRIVTLCSYRLGQCGASDVLEVAHRHHCTLDRPDRGWQILTPPPRASLVTP